MDEEQGDEILRKIYEVFRKWQEEGINDDNYKESLKDIESIIEKEEEAET